MVTRCILCVFAIVGQLSEEIKEKTVDNVIQINGEETEAVTDAAKNESEAEPIKTEKNNAITPNEDQNEHDSSENNYPANLPPDMQNENEVLALHCTTHKETGEWFYNHAFDFAYQKVLLNSKNEEVALTCKL